MIDLLKVRKNKFIYFSLKLFFLALVSYSFALVAHSFFSNLRIELLAGVMMTFSYTLFCTFYAAWVSYCLKSKVEYPEEDYNDLNFTLSLLSGIIPLLGFFSMLFYRVVDGYTTPSFMSHYLFPY